MKWYQRVLSGVLTAAMGLSLLSGIPTASAADRDTAVLVSSSPTQATGEIVTVIQIDYPIYTEKLNGATVTLYRGDMAIAHGSLQDNGSMTFTDGSTAAGTITLLTDGSMVSSVEVRMTGLLAETGSNQYRLKLTGNGFKTYESNVLELSTYSIGMVLGTGTFTLGDVNGDGAVNTADVEAVKVHLDTDNGQADLNGDRIVDISDLAIATMGAAASGEAQIYHTTAIAANVVDSTAVSDALEHEPTIHSITGEVSDLFTDGSYVTITPQETAQEVQLPIPLSEEGVLMEQVEITSSAGSPLEKGVLVAEVAGGDSITIPFLLNESIPDGVYAIQARDDGRKVVTISLGKRVPVKKITIQVDLDEAGKEVVVEQIQFLQDVLPENPPVENTQIKNVAAQAGDKQVTLTWDVFPNITGYKVYYGTSETQMTTVLETEKTSCTVTGLENLKTYYFAVAPVSTAGGQTWEGTKSAAVRGTPQPASVPDKPDGVTVTAGDTVLMVSWKPGKDTKYCKVQYRVQGEDSFTVLEGQYASSATITGLLNDVTYEVQVFGVNDKGNGPVSLTAIGTPKPEVIVAPELPTVNRLDSSVITSASYPVRNTDTNASKGSLPDAVYDGDFQTGWVASTWSLERKFTFQFDQGYEMDFLIYVPNLGRDTQKNNGNQYRDYFTSFNLWLNGKAVDAANISFERAKNNEYFIIKFPKTTVYSLAVEGSQWTGAGNISLSEIAFYEYGSLSDEISALFANDSHTALAYGVNAQQISALYEKASSTDAYYVERAVMLDELGNAQQLLEGRQDELIVRDSFTSRSGAADSQYGQSASALQPLGISALSNQYITLYVEGLGEGESISLIQWQQYSEASNTTKSYTLHKGRNRIYLSQIGNEGSGKRGGALYVQYAGNYAGNIKIQVRDTSEGKNVLTVIPMLDIRPDQWYGRSESQRKALIQAYVTQLQQYVSGLTFPNDSSRRTNIRNFTEIATPSVLLSLPADQVLAGLGGAQADVDDMTAQLYDAICAWEQLIFLANKTQGIIAASTTFDKYQYPMQTRQNIRFSRMFSGAFMFAAGSYVGIDYNETRAMVTGYPLEKNGSGTSIDSDDLNGLYGWGIAHEVGHNMDKIGYAEITNNIYSLVAQTADAGDMTAPSRLEGMYQAIFDKVALGKPGQAGDVFTQLGMYWQLHLAYDGAGSPLEGSGALDFYNAFFQAWKAGAYNDAPSKNDRIALIASQVANKDLTEFFTRWGMELSQSTKETLAGYDKESREIWYLSDQSRRDRLSGKNAANLTASVAAAENGNTVLLTITLSGDADRVQGYEILRNGTPVAFLMGNGQTTQAYTDTVGAANNMTFTYTVRVIDKLGYEADTATADGVRISYDQTISPSLYSIVRDKDTGNVIITAQDNTLLTTSGLKLTGTSIPASGAYTVTISGESYQDITAKAGSFAQNEAQDGQTYLTYFNKPGAEPTDTRIWMYDAARIVIAGIPGDVALEDIHLLSYPGDNISFTEGASIGVLEEDYTYVNSDGKIETISAGTVIITGSYRGDPLYNSIRVQAKMQAMQPGSSEAPTVTERTLSGVTLLFAEIADGTVSTISDGFFLFIPTDQAAFKQVNEDHGDNLSAGSQVMIALQAQMWRYTDTVGSQPRMTSDTLFISVPRYDSMPGIVLEQ